MSLYNLIHGVNPLTPLLLGVLGISPEGIPRFRDVFLDPDEDAIVIHTRTGGGNRDFYENRETCFENFPEYFDGRDDPSGPWNDDLRANPLFYRDRDDEFDCTYANFYFNYPDSCSGILKEIAEMNHETPREKWERVFKELEQMQK